MDADRPRSISLDEHENLVVFPEGFRIPRSYPDHCNIPAGEIDGFNCSLNLPCHAAPQLSQRGPALNRIPVGGDPFAVLGIESGRRLTVVGVSRVGKLLDKRPDGRFIRMRAWASAGTGDCSGQVNRRRKIVRKRRTGILRENGAGQEKEQKCLERDGHGTFL